MTERPGPMPQLTGEGWLKLIRAAECEEVAFQKSKEAAIDKYGAVLVNAAERWARPRLRGSGNTSHGCDGCLARLLIAGTGFAHLAVGQACAAPVWLVAGPTREMEAATPKGRRSGLLRPSVCDGSSAGPCGCACPLP